MSKKLTLENFIQKALLIHSNKYIYPKFIYKNFHTKGIITCNDHGDFLQTPAGHLSGKGCPKCKFHKLSLERKYTINDFVEKANTIHNHKYRYNSFIYNGYHIKGIIFCYDHGEFEQTPACHLRGQGCPKCGDILTRNKRKLTLEQFITKARIIHGNRYGYDNSNYENGNTKLAIICYTHGEFWQTPGHHLSGTGCPVCGMESMANQRRMTTEEFIRRAIYVHGDKYGYDKSQHKNSLEKICITCYQHGDFWQIPDSHLRGCGCPACNLSKGEKQISDILNKHNIKYQKEYKLPFYKYKYDFYLPDYNLFIEFHGQQHYEYNDFFHKSYEEFEYSKMKDSFKKDLAKEYKINIIYFNYKQLILEIDEFENKVIKILNKFKNRKLKSWICYEF